MDNDTKAMLKGTVVMIVGAFAMAAWFETIEDDLVRLLVGTLVVLLVVSMPYVWPRLEATQER